MATNEEFNNNQKNTLRYCSFCGRTESMVDFLIPSSSGVCICNYCIEDCNTIISESMKAVDAEYQDLSFSTLKKPIEIKQALDEYVIGQDEAKITLSVAVYNHYKRILSKEKSASNDEENKVELQ